MTIIQTGCHIRFPVLSTFISRDAAVLTPPFLFVAVESAIAEDYCCPYPEPTCGNTAFSLIQRHMHRWKFVGENSSSGGPSAGYPLRAAVSTILAQFMVSFSASDLTLGAVNN